MSHDASTTKGQAPAASVTTSDPVSGAKERGQELQNSADGGRTQPTGDPTTDHGKHKTPSAEPGQADRDADGADQPDQEGAVSPTAPKSGGPSR